MSTWICKALGAMAAAMALAACDELPGTAARHMTETVLAGGQMTLATPTGYCIDPRSVRKSPKAGFALVARCDTLGAHGFAARELAVISVTTAPLEPGASAPSMQGLIQAAAPAKVLEKRTLRGLPMIRLQTETGSVSAVSPQHWRTAFALNGQLVGLALYAPEASDAMAVEGPAVLADMVYRTRRASARPTVIKQPAATGAKAKEKS